MNKTARLGLFALFLGLIVFAGLLFAPFVMANIISPLALTAWLFLRIFVLSIPQALYWWALIAVGLFWIARRFVGKPENIEAFPDLVVNASQQAAAAWRDIIHLGAADRNLRHTLQRNLIQMLITLYSSRQQSPAYTEVYEPLKQRQIRLPEPVYAFLFDPEPQDTHLNLAQKLRALPQLLNLGLRNRLRRWTGQETAEYYQSIDAILTFIETTLEIPHDDEPDEHDSD